MNKSTKSSPEVHERAVRLVQEHRVKYPSLWAAVESIAPKIGCLSQTLLGWVKRHEIDNGARAGVTHDLIVGNGGIGHRFTPARQLAGYHDRTRW